MINWEFTPADAALVERIVKRIHTETNQGQRLEAKELFGLHMDLILCHMNGCKLDLDGLTDALICDLTHDVFGISNHIDRRTGKLEDFFVPRYAARVAA